MASSSGPSSKVCPRKRNDYFNRAPRNWSLEEFLQCHKDDPNPRQVLGRWKSTLVNISKCEPTCCDAACRKRARKLLDNMKSTGRNSDRRRAAKWLEIQRDRLSKEAAALEHEPSSTAVNYNVIVNSTVTGGIQQTYAEGGSEEVSSQTTPVPSPPSPEADETESWFEYDSDDLLPGTSESTDPDAAFESSFDGFDDSRKWHLRCSKRAVEDILYEAYRNADPSDESFPRGLLRNWTIDVGDQMTKNLFGQAEWDEICGSVPSLPKPTEDFGRFLARFHKVQTVAELRNVLNTDCQLPSSEDYEPAKHFDIEWAYNVLRQFLSLMESPAKPLREPHLEGWFTAHIWSFVIDHCLLSLPITLERTEVACRATSLRKNRLRTNTTKRMRSGPHLDGIIRSVEDDLCEYGGMEAIKTFHGSTTSTKWLDDTQKLVKALRDMFDRLHELVEHDSGLVGALQVVGFISGGRWLESFRLCHPGGYVCVLQRDGLQQAPTDVKQLKQLLLLLAKIVQMKAVIKACIDAVESRARTSSEEALFQEIMNSGNPGGKDPSLTLPPAADSP